MSDFAKCTGDGCLLASRCKRFTSIPQLSQTYFFVPPFIQDAIEPMCNYLINSGSKKYLKNNR